MSEIFKSIFAGISIGIAGTVYLNVGGLAGAILFAFGLIAVVSLNLWLFTGKAYKCWKSCHIQLLVILLLNLIGCLVVASIVESPTITTSAENIIQSRLNQGVIKCGLLSLGCGMIMTTAVVSAKRQNWWPLLFGVPTFILCGFPHCIADAFYLESCSWGFISSNLKSILSFYGAIVLGNYLGCNFIHLTTISQRNGKTA